MPYVKHRHKNTTGSTEQVAVTENAPTKFAEFESDADNNPCVYLLHRPEDHQCGDPNMYLWIRRCDVFTSMNAIFFYLQQLGIHIIHVQNSHALFPELTTIIDLRGFRWYVCKAPIYHQETHDESSTS
jgi:hypothetical protein